MPVKHGPKKVNGEVTVDKTCIFPGCNQDAMPGKLMCCDHEPTEDLAPPEEGEET